MANDHGLPVSGTAAVAVAERAVDLHAVRVADQAGEARSESEAVMPAWEIAWQRSLRIQRELQAELMAEIQRGQAIVAASGTNIERARRERNHILELS